MIVEVKAPNRKSTDGFSVFLAGTIDLGNSENWQNSVVDELKRRNPTYDITVFNPRRENWKDADQEEQINWELDHLGSSDRIIMVILGTSKSPISLLELGLFAGSGKLMVFCEPTFYRYENVRITCERCGVELSNEVDVQKIVDKLLNKKRYHFLHTQ